MQSIALENPANEREAVFAARVMLGLITDGSNPSNARYGTEPIEETPTQSIVLYPNPASNSVNGLVKLADQQTANVAMIDLQGKPFALRW